MVNKRGSIGTLLNWIVASLIIFVLFSVGVIYSLKMSSDQKNIYFSLEGSLDFVSFVSLDNFFNNSENSNFLKKDFENHLTDVIVTNVEVNPSPKEYIPFVFNSHLFLKVVPAIFLSRSTFYPSNILSFDVCGSNAVGDYKVDFPGIWIIDNLLGFSDKCFYFGGVYSNGHLN